MVKILESYGKKVVAWEEIAYEDDEETKNIAKKCTIIAWRKAESATIKAIT